jgi:hypothetical protein
VRALENELGTSGSVARDSAHKTREAVAETYMGGEMCISFGCLDLYSSVKIWLGVRVQVGEAWLQV